MRAIALSMGAMLLIAIAGCGDGPDEVSRLSATPLDSGDPILDGGFIDTWPPYHDIGDVGLPRGGFAAIIGLAEKIALVEVIEIVEVTVPKRAAPANWPVDELSGNPLTTYNVRVEQWIKGNGEVDLLVVGPGGITEAGPDFIGGSFPLEPGRRYTLTLVAVPATLPVVADYVWDFGGFASFEVTDGFVHVLNHPLTRELDETYGGMPEDQFVALLEDIVANPPEIPPPPTPAPTPDHADRVEGHPALVIDRMAIDVGTADRSNNGATSLGALQPCDVYGVGDTFAIDVTLDSVPGASADSTGMSGFQFELRYDPDLLHVIDADTEMLLAANDNSSLIPFSDDTPDEDGIFLASAVDFGDNTVPETGPGVLARIIFEALGGGISPLTLTGVIVTGVAVTSVDAIEYSIDEVSRASVAIGTDCPADA